MKKFSNAVADGIKRDRAVVAKLRTRIERRISISGDGPDLYSLANAAEIVVRTNAVLDDRERLNSEEVVKARAAVMSGGLGGLGGFATKKGRK